ncbi:nucleotidyltransferase family protein [Roseateles saccharophilus]|uniref:nucleotidyltransferase family protein n=1 Tax=Roseateles saccharophilus TaxID=304 RepID=UPI001A9E80B8
MHRRGAPRNLVWHALHGHATPSVPAHVDLAYFCADDLDPAREAALQRRLQQCCPGLPWEVVNQAGVHLWFEGHFGHAVGIWLDDGDALHVIAPHGPVAKWADSTPPRRSLISRSVRPVAGTAAPADACAPHGCCCAARKALRLRTAAPQCGV